MDNKNCKNCCHCGSESIVFNKKGVFCNLTQAFMFDGTADSCQYHNKDVSEMQICYNCKHFLGGGDWGLSCAKNYYSLAAALDKACDKFEKR